MTLPSSGPLSIQEINAEFARGVALGDYRGTIWYNSSGGSGNFPSGAIAISDFYGKRVYPTSVAGEFFAVAGGGGGATHAGSEGGGGGGAGGYVTQSVTLSTGQRYNVTVGAGGAVNTNGSNTVAFGFTAIGGGRGAAEGVGASGGSGGGSGRAGGSTGGAGTPGQGNAGGGFGGGTGFGWYGGGGGGGATAAGSTGGWPTGGAGGAGITSSITGSSLAYAGGGGGGGGGAAGNIGSVSAGGSGVGGNGAVSRSSGSIPSNINATAGAAGRGGGGGGESGQAGESGNYFGVAAAGGSGAVIVAYQGAQQFTGGSVSTSSRPGWTVHTFTTSGQLVPYLQVEFFMVAGGGGGGSRTGDSGSGGGGAGGVLAGTLVLPVSSHSVIVGAGGAQNASGSNSSLSTQTAIGGGRAGLEGGDSGGYPGGSGGGAGAGSAGTRVGGAGTPGQGNNGGNGGWRWGNGGSGGGASSAGGSEGGQAGLGVFTSITGSSVGYAAGGRGSAGYYGDIWPDGTEAQYGAANPGSNPRANSGCGGNKVGGAGGIVIVAYQGAPQFSGGSVSTSSRPGWTVHTFTTSGTLTAL